MFWSLSCNWTKYGNLTFEQDCFTGLFYRIINRMLLLKKVSFTNRDAGGFVCVSTTPRG